MRYSSLLILPAVLAALISTPLPILASNTWYEDTTHYYGEFGIAFQHPVSEKATDRVKFVEFGRTDELKTFERNFSIGGWSDSSHYHGVQNSAYVAAALGLETRQPGMYINYFIGPSYITAPDVLLGCHFEVVQEVGIGQKDARGVSIGAVVKHFSDGGMTKTNMGRNFVGIRARF